MAADDPRALSYRATGAALAEMLPPPPSETPRPAGDGAIDWAVAGMGARARRSQAIILRNGARQLLADPWRFDRLRLSGYTPDESLASCERRIAGMLALGRADSWHYDGNTLTALRQARLALRYLRRFQGRLVRQEAAE